MTQDKQNAARMLEGRKALIVGIANEDSRAGRR